MSQGQLTAEMFAALEPSLKRFSPEAKERARLVLVEGKNVSDVARLTGVSKQVVSSNASKVMALASSVPRGWESLDGIWLPAEYAAQVRAFAEELKKAVSAGRSADEFGAVIGHVAGKSKANNK